jgi:YVTN family beta-propeller protein
MAAVLGIGVVDACGTGPGPAITFEGASPRVFFPSGSESLTVVVTDEAGQPVPDAPVTLTSSDTSVVGVAGVVLTARTPGDATITATSGSLVGTLVVRVRGVQATIPLDRRPYGIDVSASGRFFVTRLDAHAVSGGTLPATVITDSIPTGGIPTSVAFGPSGTVAYTADQGGTVTIINAAAGTAGGSVNLPGSPFYAEVTPDGATVWVAGNTGQIYVIDTGTKKVIDTIPIGFAVNGIAFTPNGTRAFVSDPWDDKVVAVDVAQRNVVRTDVITGFVQGVAVSPDGQEVWVARQDSSVVVLSASTGAIIGTVETVPGGFGVTMADGGDVVLVTRIFIGDVVAIRRATRAVIGSLQLGSSAVRIATHPSSGTIMVAIQDGSVAVIR